MEYKVKVIYKEKEVSDNEKKDRLKQFQQAFVTAAVSYYSVSPWRLRSGDFLDEVKILI